MEEKAARGEECKIVFLYVETGKTVVEQRLSDAIYHPILNITEKDSVIYRNSEILNLKDLSLSDGANLLLENFCELFTDQEITQSTTMNFDNIHKYRMEAYRVFEVNNPFSLRRKAIDHGVFPETCPVCAKRKAKKKIIPVIISIIISIFIGFKN